jgi:hypothetical protein
LSGESSALQAAIREIAGAIRPIAEIEEGSGGKRFKGSAVVLAAGQRRPTVTAAHVVSGPGIRVISLSAIGSVVWPRKYWNVVPIDAHGSDPDVAYAIANVEAARVDEVGPAISLDRVLPDQQFREGTSMVAVGFPASKNRIRTGEATMQSRIMSVVGDLVRDEQYASVGADPSTHLVMVYRQDSCVDDEGNPVVGALPRGMSGGAMFVATHHPEMGFVPMLVGILTEYHPPPHALLVAARIEVVLDALDLPSRGKVQRFRRGDVQRCLLQSGVVSEARCERIIFERPRQKRALDIDRLSFDDSLQVLRVHGGAFGAAIREARLSPSGQFQ